MMANWLSDQGLLIAPAVALLLFLFIFACVLVWIFRPGSSAVYKREALLPFAGEKPSGPDAAKPLEADHGKRA